MSSFFSYRFLSSSTDNLSVDVLSSSLIMITTFFYSEIEVYIVSNALYYI